MRYQHAVPKLHEFEGHLEFFSNLLDVRGGRIVFRGSEPVREFFQIGGRLLVKCGKLQQK